MEIIDSHTHWGPSLTLYGVQVTTSELLQQAEQSGVHRIVVFPFPSTAIANPGINESLRQETEVVKRLIPYYYIPEHLRPIPREQGFFGGKWHWVRGIQDCSSNYDVLTDPRLPGFIEESEAVDLPIVFEEDLAFTEAFVKHTTRLKLIIPHLGMLGGNPLDFLAAFKRHPHICFDSSLSNAGTLLRFVDTIGPERVLFGSDIPFGSMKTELDKILSLPLSDDKKELILSLNIKRLTGIV